MFKRRIESVLEEWKKTPGHNPLVIKGVRQCGKTYSVTKFAKNHYKNVVYLDFSRNMSYKSFFGNDLSPDAVIMNISLAMPDVDFVAGETCLIFDEIQECPAARSSLKFFKLDGRYDVICTGSLLGVSGYKTDEERQEEMRRSIPVGYEDIVTMYPMDFEEWLWANGVKDIHFNHLKHCLENEEPVPEAMHKRMRELLLRYTVVGGMPKAVSTFLETRNYGAVLKVQRQIVDDYKVDMLKYALNYDKSRIRECFESIPAQLARENKKFSYTLVRKHGRSNEYQGSLQWIEDAGIVRRCYNLETLELPLVGFAMKDTFKVYMGDTGLFISMLDDGTALNVINGDILQYKGAIAENLMADMLGKRGMNLYYYKKTDSLELDFVVRYKNECTPIECKATTGNAKSVKTVLRNKDKYHINQALKFGNYNIGRVGEILTLPMYMAFMLFDDVSLMAFGHTKA